MDATPSNLVKGQAIFLDSYAKSEFRAPDTAALSMAYQGAKANPSFAVLREREDRSVSGYFQTRSAKSGATTRTFNHTGSRGDSLEVPITWQQSVDTFSISLKQFDNNMFSFEQGYASRMQNMVMNILTDMESKFLANLEAARTHVNVGGTDGTWDGTDCVMENPASESDYFFQEIEVNMKQNLYKGQLAAIIDSFASIKAGRQVQQGSGNATNLGWQFNNIMMAQSTSTILSGLTDSYKGAALVFPIGEVGIVPWIPKQNRQSIDPKAALTPNGSLGSINIPIYDDKGNVAYTLPLALSIYAKRADTSDNNGSTQDLLIEVEGSIDTGFVKAPLSTLRGASDTVVYGHGQLPS